MKKKLLVFIALFYGIMTHGQCWEQVAAGRQHSLAIKVDGTLWAWGENSDGQLGIGSTIDQGDPVQIGVDDDWVSVTAGDGYSLAIKGQQTLWAWGNNASGQLGLGNTTSVNVPTQVGTSGGWERVSAGISRHTLALKTNGTLWAWGINSFGQLGNGTTSNATSPTQVGSLNNWAIIATGNNTSYAIRTTGTLWAWGRNNVGQLGIGNNTNMSSPTQVGTNTWIRVAGGDGHALGIQKDPFPNTSSWLHTWGSNASGNLGNGASPDTTSNTPVYILELEVDWVEVYGGSASFAQKADGTIMAWGEDTEGQAATTGFNADVFVPTGTGGASYTHLSSRFNHTLAINASQDIKAAGNNDFLQLGIDAMWSPNFFTMGPDCPDTSEPPTVDAVNDSFSVSSCNSVSTTVSVLANDTFNGVAATISNTDMNFTGTVPSGVTLNSNGTLTVNASVLPGVYSITFRLYQAGSTTNYDTATITLTVLAKIEAVDDTYSVMSGFETTPTVPLFDNDTYDCTDATPTNTNMSLTSTVDGITLNPETGLITIDPSVPAGVYNITYELCDTTTDSTNCDEATVTITVTQSVIVANTDNFMTTCMNGVSGGTGGDVTANDTVNGNPVNDSDIVITIINDGGIPGLTINASGVLSIPANSPFGTYVVDYTICQTETENCATATVTLCVTNGINPGAGANNEVHAIIYLPDGDIIIGGAFTKYNNITRNRIARLNPDLSLDTNFDPGGFGFNNIVFALELQGSNILVGGNFTGTTNGIQKKCLARVNTVSGAIDNTFTNNNFALDIIYSSIPYVRAIKLQPDGKIVVGGNFDKVNSSTGLTKAKLTRLNSSGTSDNTFTSIIAQPLGEVRDIYVLSDGTIFAGGTYLMLNSSTPNLLYRVTPTGALVPGFTLGQMFTSSDWEWVNSIRFTPAGKLLVGGKFASYNHTGPKNIAQLNVMGVHDPIGTFNPGTSTDNDIRSIALDVTTTDIFIGGMFSSFNNSPAPKIARINANGSFDSGFSTGTGFTNTLLGFTSWVRVIKLQPDSKVLVGGMFTIYNGNQAKYVTRIVQGSPAVQGRLNMFADEERALSIYPNPSEGLFTIDFKGYDEQKFDVTVYNTLGQLVYKGEMTTQSPSQLDLSGAQQGNYFITLQNSHETINKIITKK